MAAERGGARPGAGRPKGPSSARLAKMREAARLIEARLPRAFQGDAHALMMLVYKDPNQPITLRLDAAKSAISYEKPALARVESRNTHVIDDQRTPDEMRAALVEKLAAMLGGGAESAELGLGNETVN